MPPKRKAAAVKKPVGETAEPSEAKKVRARKAEKTEEAEPDEALAKEVKPRGRAARGKKETPKDQGDNEEAAKMEEAEEAELEESSAKEAKPKGRNARAKKDTHKDPGNNEEAVEPEEAEEAELEEASVKEAKPKGRTGRAKKEAPKDVEDNGMEVVELEETEEAEPEEASAKEVKPRGRAARAKKEVPNYQEQDNGDEEEPQKKSRGRKARAGTAEPEEKKESEPKEKKPRGRKLKPEAESNEDAAPAEPKEKKPRGRKAAAKEDNEEDEPAEPKAKKGRAKEATNGTALMNPTETNYDNIDFSCDKKNKLGDEHNFIISSWNVDGVRAWLKKGGLAYLDHEKPNIFCIQESKCSIENLPPEMKDLKGYHQYWQNSEKEGYAGVGILSTILPINVTYGVGVPEHDEDSRCITAEYEKFYVVCVYVPNAGRGLVTLPKRLEWNKVFKSYIKELDNKKPVIICGDMNVAHTEVDLANPKTNAKNAGFTKEEREGMTEFLADGYIDTFRKLNPDKVGAYTFWTYMSKSRSKNVGWRLDYFLVSDRLMDNICDNVIRSEVLGSDHCPIVLFINV